MDGDLRRSGVEREGDSDSDMVPSNRNIDIAIVIVIDIEDIDITLFHVVGETTERSLVQKLNGCFIRKVTRLN